MIIEMSKKREKDQEKREKTFHKVESVKFTLVTNSNDIFLSIIFFKFVCQAFRN